MKFNKYFGFTFTFLGSIALLFFGCLFLVTTLPGQFDVDVQLPTELRGIAYKLTINDPTIDLIASQTSNPLALIPYNLFGQSIFLDQELFFTFAVALTVIGLGLTLASFTSLFSPMSSIVSFILAVLLGAGLLFGSIFQTTLDLDNITTGSLVGASTLASPFFGIIFGSIFQFIYFGQRKRKAKVQ